MVNKIVDEREHFSLIKDVTMAIKIRLETV